MVLWLANGAGYGFAEPAPVPANPPGDTNSLPALDDAQRTFLSRTARRTIRDALLGRARYEPDYVPAALAGWNGEAVVRLRRDGYLLAAGAGGPVAAALAVRDAALGAFETLRAQQPADSDLLHRLLVEIELVGPAEPFTVEGDWTQPRVIDPHIEPGVHGMVLVGPTVRHRFTPTELFTSDMTIAEALQNLTQSRLREPSELGKTQLFRFRTDHWYEPSSGAKIVALSRGLTPVPPEAVSRPGLDEAIDRLAAYMAYRQKPTGVFTYQYEPALDRYTDEDNVVRQAGATAAMAVHARWSGSSASRAAADLAIRYHLQGVSRAPGSQEATFITTADGKNKLGVTALLTMALAEHPDPARYEETRRKLVQGMLHLQQPSGMFLTAFPPAVDVAAQDYFPGEALLALAAEYDHQPSAAILDAFDRAIRYYREHFRGAPSPAFVPWQVQAYSLIARHTGRRDYVDFVFELTDWLADHQLDRANCPWPELWGGIAPYQPGRAGVSTASYLEGFTDALTLARHAGDEVRTRRYERLVREAARFVLQLQVRPEEAYFVRSPKDAVWGVRTAPALNLLRIDHAQHALVALIKTRRVLYGERS